MVYNTIIWIGPGLTQVFGEEHFERSNSWKIKQVVLTQTVQYELKKCLESKHLQERQK